VRTIPWLSIPPDIAIHSIDVIDFRYLASKRSHCELAIILP
jgi:hypothetical protein